MATMKVKTKNQNEVGKKPRVYFTCHPEDFRRYFEAVCKDLFASHDCAVYYTEDLSEAIPERDKEVDLGRANLFVVPVTYRLLATPNRAMDEDIPYALKKHIPVLPLLMESGIDFFYEQKFGKLQYLSPYGVDRTAISYEEKLKKYLESVLISDELARRVRAAFDAYVFLSYRKKDRAYANELMRLIHAHPDCRDVAIWFDEFLTPGESFEQGIKKALKGSKLFALLVTPNLLEEPGGKPNFVMGKEYPAAKKSGLPILPAEMETTDKEKLNKKFKDLPPCTDPKEEEAFRQHFLSALSRVAVSENDEDPEHNFLIGLAYLEGIDVEVNRERGVALITQAAEAGLLEAMNKLYWMYSEGKAVAVDYEKALHWANRLWEHCKDKYGEESPQALTRLNNLALTYSRLGDYKKAAELNEAAYALRKKVLGEEHPATLTSLSNLALTYGDSGNYRKALEFGEAAYTLFKKVLGEEHPNTLTSLNNLAGACSDLGDYRKALELHETAYALCKKILGEEHPNTLTFLSNLAGACSDLGDYRKALELHETAYTLRKKVLGEEHPDTLTSLGNLGFSYYRLGNHRKALELNETAYTLRKKVLGEEHPDTLTSLGNLGFSYYRLGDYRKAAELGEKVYALRKKVLGEEHPDTLSSLNNLAVTYSYLGDYRKAQKLNETVYALCKKLLGEEHPDTLTSLNNLAYTYGQLGNHEKEAELTEKLYALHKKVLGEEDPDTLRSLSNLAYTYGQLGDHKKEAELEETVYALRKKVLGEEHPKTLLSLSNLAYTYGDLGDYETALPLQERLYALFKKILGEEHPKTQKALERLTELRQKLNQ